MGSLVAAVTATSHGVVSGSVDLATGIARFLGIPYAAAPVGELRFERPVPPASWSGQRESITFGPRCVQRKPFSDIVFRSSEMSEDCLTLNIWTPRPADPEAMLPILVYVHGGGFLVGDGSEPRLDGAALAAHGIVVVTVNHRLGIFGFFAHPELAATNLALWDLIAALKWMRSNARAFGGAPGRITMAGSSSGAFAVGALLGSSVARDLVAGAVIQSGALLGSDLSGLDARLQGLEAARDRGRRAAAAIGATSARELKSLPASRLLEMGSGWNLPVIDGDLITGSVIERLEASDAPRVPLLAGITSAERSFDASLALSRMGVDSLRALLTRTYRDAVSDVLAAYGSPRTESETRIATRDILADEWTGIGTFRACAALSARGAPVFSYVFDHSRPQPVPGSGGWTTKDGAGHSTDIEYFLGTQPLAKAYPWSGEDQALSMRMIAHLAQFAKSGSPNCEGHPTWPDFRTGRRQVLSIRGGTRDLAATSILASLRIAHFRASEHSSNEEFP